MRSDGFGLPFTPSHPWRYAARQRLQGGIVWKRSSPRRAGLTRHDSTTFVACMQNDIEREQYDGAVVIVARGGQVVLHQALGFAERASQRVMQKDAVFYLFSVTKALTATAILARVDRGQLALTTRVAEIIPEFASKGKQRVTIAQLLTHTAGMSAGFPPVAQEMMGNLEAVVAAICQQGLDALPGEIVSYSPITAHAILGEVVRRLDGGERSLRQIFAENIFTPLGMSDTALGLRPDLAERRVPVVVRDRREGLFPPEVLEGFNVMLQEDTEIPGGGGVGTAADIFRLAEMLRRGGETGRSPHFITGCYSPGRNQPYRSQAQ